MTQRALMSPFWLAGWAFMVALAWLLPNHYLPWTAFHLDAWMALACLLAAGAVLLRSRQALGWRPAHAVLLAVACVPALQWAFGLVHFGGVAGMHTAYLLGLWLAVLIGEQWERHSPGQLGSALFLAVALAAFLSVGLQLHQWLQLTQLEIWIMPDKFGRPFANLGQPNQLATLQLWGLLALLWAYLAQRVRARVACLGAAFLLLGLALTASRTSWIGLGWLVLALWFWRRHWPDRRLPWVASLLVLGFFILQPQLAQLRDALLGGAYNEFSTDSRVTLQGESRPTYWLLLLDGLRHAPWSGYGWGQLQAAQFQVALDHVPTYSFFAHAHNLVLELLVVMGIPLGLLALLLLGGWAWARAANVRAPRHAVLAIALLVMLNHAMLELPLHYGYFLWPAGLLAGALQAGTAPAPTRSAPRWLIALALGLLTAWFGLVVRDYSRVEPEYQTLRFEWARIRTPPAQVPDVLVLDQFPAFVRAVRLEPRAPMGDAELAALKATAYQFPSSAMLRKLALAQAVSGQPQEAARSLQLLCKISQPELCRGIEALWREEAASSPALRAVPWPGG